MENTFLTLVFTKKKVQGKHEPAMCPCGKGGQQPPRAAHSVVPSAGEGGDPGPLLSPAGTLAVLGPALGSPVREGIETLEHVQ